ncbi:MAG TPA: extracellular solute-binding protein, partial [Anaerolineae bacterium]|nr:extracellular solute-binding protein [Anaerolineae bacterium]
EAPAAEAPPAEGVTKIRWYIGLGAGGNPEEIEKENAFVEAFNAKYGDKYQLVADIVQSATANDVLKTQIASGDCPDIVGPVGVRGMAGFEGAWLDMAPFVEASGYDVSDFNPALMDFYNLEGQGQIGLPFAAYPSALWYNKDLFDEAGLEYPPHEWGAPYADGDAWTFDKLKELAMILTVDANGNDATSPDFDPNATEQFGYDAMWTDVRGKWTFFGAGSFADADGNAQMPDVWREAAKWYYDGMWTSHFIPSDSYVNSDLLAQGNTFDSGAVAMNPIHTWYTCCATNVPNWDLAAIPSYNDNITAKLHADTFGILKCSSNPQAAFDVLTLMLGEYAPDLVQVYGAFPARQSLQESSLAAMQEKFPNADLQVFVDALSYPDNPNHESGMPNFLKATDAYSAFGAKYQSTPDLDLDAELDALVAQLQTIFDEVK